MALSKIDPKKIFKMCSLSDSAIDHDATGEENLKKFQETYDIQYLKFKEGEFPTIFHVKNILSSDEAKIKQEHLKIEFPQLKDMEPTELAKVKIKELKPTVTQVKSQEMIVKYFDYAISKYEENGETFDCHSSVFPYSVVQEIGSIIMMRAQLGEDLKNVLGS